VGPSKTAESKYVGKMAGDGMKVSARDIPAAVFGLPALLIFQASHLIPKPWRALTAPFYLLGVLLLIAAFLASFRLPANVAWQMRMFWK
jgi:hypothetical protein